MFRTRALYCSLVKQWTGICSRWPASEEFFLSRCLPSPRTLLTMPGLLFRMCSISPCRTRNSGLSLGGLQKRKFCSHLTAPAGACNTDPQPSYERNRAMLTLNAIFPPVEAFRRTSPVENVAAAAPHFPGIATGDPSGKPRPFGFVSA